MTYNYAVGGDPLTTSVADTAGTVTTKVDLLGRVLSYMDVQGSVTTNTYNQVGRLTQQVVTPPNTADAAQTTAYTYDDAGRVLTTQLGTTTLATASYDTNGELASVSYANGSSLAAIGKDTAGRVTSLTWQTSDAVQTVSKVDRTRAGTIYDESVAGSVGNPSGPDFSYDAVGRLTEAWMKGHHFTYNLTSTADPACPTGTQANAGVNSNRMRMIDQVGTTTATTSYCYDAADRLIATTGATALTGITYDSHGNTTADFAPLGAVATTVASLLATATAIDANPDILWVQLPAAGVEAFASAGIFTRPVMFTCAKGSFAEQVAEHALMLALACLRQLVAQARVRAWHGVEVMSLRGKRVTILGAMGVHLVDIALGCTPH